jgi:hypothetical protein
MASIPLHFSDVCEPAWCLGCNTKIYGHTSDDKTKLIAYTTDLRVWADPPENYMCCSPDLARKRLPS